MLPTVRSTLPYHPILADCRVCLRSRLVDLAALDAAGRGDTPLVRLPLRCVCGSRDVSITVGSANMMKFYRGLPDGTVLVQPEPDTRREDARALSPRHDLFNHSPTGFNWGYGGSGPTQLALALACDVLGDDMKARRLYQQLKWRWVTTLPIDKAWGPEHDLRSMLAEIEKEKGAAGNSGYG